MAGGLASISTAGAGVNRPALLGGNPVRTAPFPEWPAHGPAEENALRKVLHSGKWFRGYGDAVDRFEHAYAKLNGAGHCVATANGTSALLTALNALDVGPGDEVIVPPYTFIATVNVVLLQYALPVFVDSDLKSFQIDAAKVERAVTGRTAAMIPVHLGGSAADLDTILDVGRRRGIPVVEDACQAHMAEWKGNKVGTLGAAGCFSFQASKNLNSGEGGAILTDDAELASRCFAFHNNSRTRRGMVPVPAGQGANLRMTEFQGELLLAQMARLKDQARQREENARRLTALLDEVEGIHPAQMHPGCTRNAYHLYMFRYGKEAFAGLSRERFLEALRTEGIPCSGGYTPLNKSPFLKRVLSSKGYRAIYSAKTLGEWEERNACPVNNRLCDEAVWLTQNMLLGGQQDTDDIVAAIRKVQAAASELREVAG